MISSGNVTVLERGERTIYLVGTAHISRSSVVEVEQIIEEFRPDTVCVELDANRYQTLTDESQWKKLDIFQVIKRRKVPLLLVSLALAAYQRRLGDKLGVRPGAEMLAAIRKGEQVGAELVLADRDIQVTLMRTFRNLSLWNKIKLFGSLLGGMFDDEEISEERLEELKQGETLSNLMQEFTEQLPQVKTPLIDERDAYLMARIEQAPGQTIVAVVGIGHVQGMVERFGSPADLAALEIVPPGGKLGKALKWVIPTLILAAFTIGYYQHSGEGLGEMLRAWIIPNSVFAALFSLLAGSRLLSALTAVVASPITSLNPTIQAGMIVGLVEAWLRKPTVADCERIREDAQSLRGLYRNPFTRVLLVSIAASLGSAVGAWIGGAWVFSKLGW